MGSRLELVSRNENIRSAKSIGRLYALPHITQIDEDKYDIDPRVNDITPIIKSMEFLLKETDKDEPIHRLIAQTFKMVLVAQDLIDNQIRDESNQGSRPLQ